jgi:hypothetical protein
MTMLMTSSKHVRNIPISSCDNACSIHVFSIEFKQFLLMHTEEGHRIHDVDVDADFGVHLDIHDLLIASRTFQASPLTLTFFSFSFVASLALTYVATAHAALSLLRSQHTLMQM